MKKRLGYEFIILNLKILTSLIFALGKKEYEYHEPTQAPINPPYKESVELRRQQKLQKPETFQLDKTSENQNVKKPEENFINEFFVVQLDSPDADKPS